MEFKSLFIETRRLLKLAGTTDINDILTPALSWVDLDKGQLERYSTRPAVTFPCGLISISIPKAQNINHTTQQCVAQIVVRLAFDYTGETNSELDDDLLNESLAYFDTADLVYKAMQAKTNGQMSPLQRTSQIEEPARGDGIKVLRLTFTTMFSDVSAKAI